MRSLILATATRYILPLLLLFSVFLLVRGHNDPGGGFVGGLVAASAFALYAVAFDVESARRALGVDPRTVIGLGLLTATASGLVGLVGGRPLLTGAWSERALPLVGHFGTPVLFDVGVYLVVIGATLTIIFALAES